MKRDFTKDGWPKLLRDLRDFPVETRTALENGLMTIPAGTRGVVNSAGNSWMLLSFKSAACSCCGVSARISRLGRHQLKPLPKAMPLLGAA